MPRPGWTKPETDRRLTDAVSIGLLTRVFPRPLIDDIIEATGAREQRARQLPAWAMVYFAIGMALHNDGSYEDILALVTDGLAWAHRENVPDRLASKAAVSHARTRLGSEPVKELFTRTARPLAVDGAPGCFLAGRRLVAIDGTCLDVPDTPANDDYFSRPGTAKGEQSAFPQARVVAVAEVGTHAILDANITAYSASENEAATPVLDRLGPGQLCLADRGFYSHRAWTRAARTGADLCFRVRANLNLPVIEQLSDGSYLTDTYDSQTDRRREHPTRARVVEYTLDDGVDDHDETYRLITTIIDPDTVSAAELAAAYTERWEIETAFDELKTHQRGPRRVLRSAKPDLVEQEIWGHLCCHYAIRSLMYDATAPAGRDPDRASFVTALRITRRSIAQEGAFSP